MTNTNHDDGKIREIIHRRYPEGISEFIGEAMKEYAEYMIEKERLNTLDMVISLLPVTHSTSKKGQLKAGFYQGQKFVNTTLRWRLENLKKPETERETDIDKLLENYEL